MIEAISFLQKVIGRWHTAAGGRDRSIPPTAGGQGSALDPGSTPGAPLAKRPRKRVTPRFINSLPKDIFCQTPCRNTGSFGV